MASTSKTISQRIANGKAIRSQISLYPLPVDRSKEIDVVCFFVPKSDDYGDHARRFFKTYYRYHKKLSATSLENMFAKLARLLRRGQKGITIRELVLVSHGNKQSLHIPITHRDYVLKSRGKSGFSFIHPSTLAYIQENFVERHPTFAKNRSFIVSKFSDRSWIAVRACNFGYSKDGMYALYSFFGGRANLLAIRGYITFAYVELVKGQRISSKAEAIHYLRRQGLIDRTATSRSGQHKLNWILRRNQIKVNNKVIRVLPFQFFTLSKSQKDIFEGLELIIASNRGNENKLSKSEFRKVIVELNAGGYLRLIKLLSALADNYAFEGPIQIRRIKKDHKWALKSRLDGEPVKFVINATHDIDENDQVQFDLKLYSKVTTNQKFSSEYPWVYIGFAYDVPGCELQAQLNYFDIEELVDLQEYVRNNYKTSEAILIEHAQRSISFRKFFGKWESNTACAKKISNTNDPLFGSRSEPSCYWYPSNIEKSHDSGLKDNEFSDLEHIAHTDHNGFILWVDTKRRQDRGINFSTDLFLEKKLPFKPDIPSDYAEADILSMEANTLDPQATDLRQQDRLATGDKDDPFIGLPSPSQTPEAPDFSQMSDEEFDELIDNATKNLRGITLDNSASSILSKTEFSISIILSAGEQINAISPSSLIGRIFALRTVAIFGLIFTAIIAPMINWIAQTLDFHYQTERFRLAGLRDGLRDIALTLRVIAHDMRKGVEYRRPIVLRDHFVKSYTTLYRWSDFSNPIINKKYNLGYNYIINKVTVINDITERVLKATDHIIESMLKEKGFTNAQIKKLIERGIVKRHFVWASALEGLANDLVDRVEKYADPGD